MKKLLLVSLLCVSLFGENKILCDIYLESYTGSLKRLSLSLQRKNPAEIKKSYEKVYREYYNITEYCNDNVIDGQSDYIEYLDKFVKEFKKMGF